MNRCWIVIAILFSLALSINVSADENKYLTVKVSKQPMHSGYISKMLYGSFIELWDDHVPGMWAEMLNDRNFEGVVARNSWNYYCGEPNTCDRVWEKNDTWSYVNEKPFNRNSCAKLTATKTRKAILSQSDFTTKKGMTYHFSGWFRTDAPKANVKVILKTLLPNENWITLASSEITVHGAEWKKYQCKMDSTGTTDRAIFEIQFTGEGNLWLDKASLMPADNVNGWRKDVVEAIKEMSPPIIRWGGCAVDPGNYKWKENVGDRDFRVPFDNWFWGRTDSNDVGIDEFLQFCEAVGSEPMICVSFSDGAESAGHLVHYCNDNVDTEWGKKRAANGHPAPYKVKIWQLGNELDNDEYIAGYIDLCKAIKNADPEAVIFASFPSQKLLNSAGQYMDYICPHYYRDDFDNVESEIIGIKDMLKKTVPDRDIKIGVTEWNVTNPWGFDRGRLLTLYFALGNARFLNIFHRNSDRVQLACRSNMCNSLCDGAIQTKPSSVLKTAGYYVMKLYTEHSKPVPVAIEGLLEEMDASACRSEDGKSLTLFLVNLKAEPVDVNLDLSEYGTGFKAVEAEMVCDTLDRRQADVMNHWTLPDVIRITKLPVSDSKVTLPALSVAAIECRQK